MTLKPIEEVKDAGEAEQIAIDWQSWSAEQSLSYGELAEHQDYFRKLANKFHLREVFEENGII